MKRVAAPLVGVLIFSAPVWAQSNWQKINLEALGVTPGASVNSITTSGNLVLGSISGDPIYKAIRSIDGGVNWESPLTVLAPSKLKSLSSTFLYGVRLDSILTSTTQGLSWSLANASVNLNMTPADVHYINSSPGQAWAVGDTSYAAATGNNWGSFTPQPFSVDSVSMTSVQFIDNNFGFAAGRSRKAGSNATVILRTTDGGQSWQDRSLPGTCNSTPILVFDFVTPDIGWAAQTCGTNVTIYKTGDAGLTWVPQYVNTLFLIYAIDAVNPLYAWAGGQHGAGGAIVKTSNGGSTWSETQPPSSGRLLSIAMRDTANGFACGQSATLHVYSPISTDVPGEGSNRPKNFELSQNYPNPFNGETRIIFTLQKGQQVSLTVYNILGQPVRKLLDETRPAGKNEIGWDGKDESGLSLPSGIYLYKLGTRDEKQIRKMVLLK